MLESTTKFRVPSWRKWFPFESHFLDVEGQRLHYLDEGRGEPLLFVHGNPTWSFYYRNLIQEFRSEYRAVAVDHIGCGFSDKPRPYNYCLDQHIANLIQLIDDLSLTDVTLVAHDWGGAIGLGALLSRRERFRRVVLFNTGAFPPPYIPFRVRVCGWPLVGRLVVQGFNGFARMAITMASEQPGGLPREVAEGFLAPYRSWHHRTAIYRFVRDIPSGPQHPSWHTLASIENQLAELADWPIQLIWGMKDWCFRPECLEKFLTYWPDARVARLNDAGHYVVEDSTREVVHLMSRFLHETKA